MIKPVQRRRFMYGGALVASIVGLAVGQSVLRGTATAQQSMVEVPIFEVDPLWPKPLPDEGLLGMTIGVSVDEQDNVWIVHPRQDRKTTRLNSIPLQSRIPSSPSK